MGQKNIFIALFFICIGYTQADAGLVGLFSKEEIFKRENPERIIEWQRTNHQKGHKTPAKSTDKKHGKDTGITDQTTNSNITSDKNTSPATHEHLGSAKALWYPDYRHAPFEASAESKTVDPQATNYEKEEGFTQNYAQIHGFYEHLSTYYFPYQPYYKHPLFYWMHEEKNDRKVWADFTTWTRSVFTAKPGNPHKFKYYSAEQPDGTKAYVPFDERFRHAWTALYLADPSSIAAFGYYAMTMLPQEKLLMDNYEYPMEDRKQGIINSRKNLLLLYTDKFEQMREDRDRIACTLAIKYLKFNDVVKYVKERFGEYKTANNAYGKLLGGWVGHAVYEKILLHHKDYKATAPGLSQLKNLNQEFLNSYDDLSNELIIFIAASKAVTVSADIKTPATAAARAHVGDAFEGILFYNIKWNGVKESSISKRIVDYTIPIAIIFNENGKHLLRNGVLHKSLDGLYSISIDEKEADKE